MKILTVACVFLLCASATGYAQWNKDGERVPDTANRKSINGFGGHLIIVANPQAFIEEWQKPETPKIKTLTNVKRGELIGAFVLFVGCKPDAQQKCNSEVDYAVYKPDGSLYAERRNEPLWKDQAPPGRNIQLSMAILGIRMDKNDPSGEYRVKAKVSDLNAEISFELETTFLVK
jgi:hypothetical protein